MLEWHAAAAPLAEVRLCVAAPPRPDSSSCADTPSSPATDVASWCVEHGFELVPAQASGDEPAVPEDVCSGEACWRCAGGLLAGESSGMARVREALEAHAWPGLIPKPRAKSRASAAAAKAEAEAAASAKAGTAHVAMPSPPPLPRCDASAPRGVEGEGGGGGCDEDAFEELMGAMLQARDAAASGALTDGQRRAAAASLALRMAVLMGGDSDGGNRDDSE